MQICFSLPHIIGSQSSPIERERVQSVLKSTLSNLEKVYLASHAAQLQGPSGVANSREGKFIFNLPNVFNSSSLQTDDDKSLRILLEGLISINDIFLDFHPTTPDLYNSGTVYRRTQIWQSIPDLYRKRFGDCKSLTAAMVSQYRRKGIECRPVFRWVRDGSDPFKKTTHYHILVLTSRGFEDPSKVLGMGKNALY